MCLRWNSLDMHGYDYMQIASVIINKDKIIV